MLNKFATSLLLTATIFLATDRPAKSQPITRSISGSLLIVFDHYGYTGKPCNAYNSKPLNDLKFGFPIVVRNGRGDILATSTAPAGSTIEVRKPLVGDKESTVNCEVTIPPFTVPDSEFYAIELAGRKPIVKSRSDLAASGWRLDLSIGN
jgi:hypothetical protein